MVDLSHLPFCYILLYLCIGKTLSLLCATLEWLSRHTDAANRLEELGEEDPTHDNGIHFQVTQKETSECMKTGDADDAETERKGEVKGIVGLKEGVYQEDETINEENENVIELRKMAGGSLAKTIQELKDIKRNKEEIDNNQCTATNSSPSSSTSSSSSRSSSSTASSSTFEEPDWLFASVTETKKRQREERASLAKRIREYFTSLLEGTCSNIYILYMCIRVRLSMYYLHRFMLIRLFCIYISLSLCLSMYYL